MSWDASHTPKVGGKPLALSTFFQWGSIKNHGLTSKDYGSWLTSKLFNNLFIHHCGEFRSIYFFTRSRHLCRSYGWICLIRRVMPLPFWLFLRFVPFWRKHSSQLVSTWVHQSVKFSAVIWDLPRCLFIKSLWLSLNFLEVSIDIWVCLFWQVHLKRNRPMVRYLCI